MWRLLIGAVCVLVATTVLSGCSDEDGAPLGGAPVQGSYSLDKAQTFDGHALYFLGSSFEGLDLTAVEREVSHEEDIDGSFRIDIVTFVYGDCDVAQAEGEEHATCTPPLQVQTICTVGRDELEPGGEGPVVVGATGSSVDLKADDVLVRIWDDDPDRLQLAQGSIGLANAAAKPGACVAG